MRIGLAIGITCAVLLHLAVIMFGKTLFTGHGKNKAAVQQVELLSSQDMAAEKEKEKEKERPPEQDKKLTEEMQEEAPPDAAEVIRNLELSAAASAPALEAASLSAIEAALSGGAGGSGDFSQALSFASGGRIGGMAKAGVMDESSKSAFSLSEIDQKPRPIFQSAPVFPPQLAGKKVDGLVTVLFVVDASGKVSNPRVEKSSHPAFERPAVDAVKQWKFEPAVRGGKRVACKVRAPIRFQPREAS
jgi:protein TonB